MNRLPARTSRTPRKRIPRRIERPNEFTHAQVLRALELPADTKLVARGGEWDIEFASLKVNGGAH